MRIAVDGRPLVHPNSGIGVYTRCILERIAPFHDVYIYLDRPLPETRIEGATYRPGPTMRLTGLVMANIVFAHWARQDQADVFWGPRHHLPLMLAGIPSVVTIHDLVWMVAPETMRTANRWLDTIFMPIALRRAKHIIAVSTDTAEKIRKFEPSLRPTVVHEAAAMPKIKESYVHPRPYFLFVGTKEPRKNLQRTLQAFDHARQRQHDMTHDLLLVGGAGWRVPELASMIATTEHVFDLGNVDETTLARLYAGCTALVLASLYEGFGLPIVEAMQFGKPIITSRRGSMPEVAGEAAIFVDPMDTDDMANAFVRLASDHAYREQLAEAAKREAMRFSWDKAAKHTVDVFRQALNTTTS